MTKCGNCGGLVLLFDIGYITSTSTVHVCISVLACMVTNNVYSIVSLIMALGMNREKIVKS